MSSTFFFFPQFESLTIYDSAMQSGWSPRPRSGGFLSPSGLLGERPDPDLAVCSLPEDGHPALTPTPAQLFRPRPGMPTTLPRSLTGHHRRPPAHRHASVLVSHSAPPHGFLTEPSLRPGQWSQDLPRAVGSHCGLSDPFMGGWFHEYPSPPWAVNPHKGRLSP